MRMVYLKGLSLTGHVSGMKLPLPSLNTTIVTDIA